MNRPYIICHMTTSLDGKVTGEHLRRDNHGAASEVYYAINRNYKADAYACGRITMESSFTGGWYPDLSEFEPAYSPMDYLVDDMGDFFAVAFDPHGRLGWKSNRIIDADEDPGYDKARIIEVLTHRVSGRYLTYLQSMGIPYIFAGDTEIDVEEALFKLKAYFGIEKLLLEGGSILNGAFQRAGVIDELSLVVDPVIGGEGKPLCMDSTIQEYRLTDVKNYKGIVWLNYHASHALCYKPDYQKLADACEQLFDLDNLGLSNSYYYRNLPLCVIDSVFSIGVRYTSTQNTVLNYCKAFGLTPYDRQRNSAEQYHTISQLISNLEKMGVQNSATTIFKNHQRTSTTNGILKAEAVYQFAKILQKHKIESFADLYSTTDLALIEQSVKQIPGQGSGLSWQYFLMLSGNDDLAKPDRHVLRFIEKQLGYKPSVKEAQQLMTATVALLKPKHPNLTVRLLDYSIWDASAHINYPNHPGGNDMRKNFGAKPMCYPMPVYIIGTYGADGTPNAMNAAWGGISEDKEISICVDSSHKTAENILARKAFTVSMATARYMRACDYVGIVSGNKVPDKFARAGFHATRSEFVDAPLIDELPMAVECKLISYDPESCRLVGEIVNVSVDEAVLGENGKVDVKQLQPITYDPMNHHYLVLGEKVGQAFHDGMALK